jgi:hypothetical protein
VAGLKELMHLIGGNESVGVETLWRRMAVLLGTRERNGCLRLDD